ncbi:MAG: ABC transporter ATP-binding protein [Acidimicrobiales bacterium]
MDRLRQWEVWQLFSVLHRAEPKMSNAFWVLVVLRGALPAGFALAMGRLVSAVQNGDDLTSGLVAIGCVFVLMQSLGPIHNALSSNLGASASSWLHDRLLEACTGPSGLAHLEDARLADRLSTARDFDLGITGPRMAVTITHIGGGLAALFGGAFQMLLLFGYSWWAPLVVGGGWLSTHRLLRSGATWRGRTSEDVMEQQRQADYAYRLAVHDPAAKELRLFGLADWVVGGFAAVRHHLMDQSWAERRLHWRPTCLALALIAGANAVFFWSLAQSASSGSVTIGALVVYGQAAIGTGTLAFGDLDWMLHTSAQPMPLVLGLLDDMASAGALAEGHEPGAGLPRHDITFAGVGFAYPNAARKVFDDFDLTIPAGQSLAIVGQNGAGKTTLAKLLCRLYDPDQGRITVDGIDLRTIDIADWRRRVAAVFQDFVRYELTLRENVAPTGADDEVILAALADARAEGIAELDTVLAAGYEGGTDLSGGQWQRVALARALAAVRLGAGVVILDEPTAQLDVRGEAEIFERLLEATRGCTTILISPRFSTVRRADRICVIEEGRVVEEGTHEELMARRGRYQTMFDLQAARFDDPDAEVLT